MDRLDMMDSIDGRREMTNKPRIKVHSSSSDDGDREREEDEAQQDEVAEAKKTPPLGWNHNHHEAAVGIGNNRRRLLSKQLSMKETTREAKWEKRRRQILRRSSLVSVNDDGGGGGNKSAVEERHHHHHVMRSSSERAMRCLTDEDLDELLGSFELGFGFDEETGGAHLRDTLPALEFYFAVNRQLSDPKLRTPAAASPTSTLLAVSSSSTLPDIPSPRSPNAGATASGGADTWKIFTPGTVL
jgi:hypothetical protein